MFPSIGYSSRSDETPIVFVQALEQIVGCALRTSL